MFDIGWLRGLVATAEQQIQRAPFAREVDPIAGTVIDPHFHQLAPNNMVASYTFDKLVHMDEHQHPIAGLATEWKALDDTTWEFKLRRGVKFHDGAEFTAADVLATFRRVPNVPKLAAIMTSSAEAD